MTPSHNGLSPLRSLSAAQCDETMQRVPDSVVLQCSTLKRSAANSLRRLQGRYQLYRKGRWVDLAYVAAQEGHVNCVKLLAQHGFQHMLRLNKDMCNFSLFSLSMELTSTSKMTMHGLQFTWLARKEESTALHSC